MASVDPGVLAPSATGTGQAGTACAGTTFTVAVVDAAQGKYSFTPSTAVVLGPPASATSTCIIDFTVTVVKTPTKDADAKTAGFQTDQIGAAFVTASDGQPGGGFGTNQVTVTPGTVPVATQVAPTAITLGGPFSDTATLSPPGRAAVPTGTVTVNVYGPGDPTCAAAPVFSSTNALNAAGTTAVSSSFTPTTAGTYRVIATYNGDANYNPVSTSCADPTEAVVVAKAPLPVATQVAPTPITLGASFHDTATLGPAPAGAATPTGMVTFNVYGPADPTCAAAPVFTSANPLNAAGTTATSGTFTPTTTGTYRVIATYTGDANYLGSSSSCSDPAEAVVVNRAPLPIATAVAPAPIALGASFHDTATLGPLPAGAAAPTGSVTFNVYGPADTTCAAAPVFTSTNALPGAGTSVTSGTFTPTITGTRTRPARRPRCSPRPTR